MRKLALLAVLTAVVAAPAFAEVQNVKLSGYINTIGLQRNDFDFGFDSTVDADQNIFISQTALHVNADLTDQVSATVGLLNEKVWGDDSAGDDDMDLYLAYVTLREFLYSPLTVVAGRQTFAYGNSLIVDATGQNNDVFTTSGLDGVADDLDAGSSVDAIRAILDYNPLTVELLWAKIDEEENEVASPGSANDDDIDLYGIYTTYAFGNDLNTTLDAYVFHFIDRDDGAPTPFSPDYKIYVPGIRLSTNVTDAINVQAEIAHQFGEHDSVGVDVDAWAGQFIGSWAIPGDDIGLEGMNPTLQYVYTYASGDDDSGSGDEEDWDALFEAQGGGTIYNSLFDLSNLHIHTVSLSLTPVEDVTTKLAWSGLWLAEDNAAGSGVPFDGGPNGASIPSTVADESDLGHEVDFDVTYAYTEDVSIGASLGWFFPGDAFASTNQDAANQALVNAKVRF